MARIHGNTATYYIGASYEVALTVTNGTVATAVTKYYSFNGQRIALRDPRGL